MKFNPACFVVIAVMSTCPLPAAEDAQPVEGVMLSGGKTFPLKYAVAYETRENDETLISVVASDRRIPVADIRKELDDRKGNDRLLVLGQPYVRVVFKNGKPLYAAGAGTNSNFGVGDKAVIGELTIAEGVVNCVASVEKDAEGPFQRAFALKIKIPFGLDSAAARPAAPTAPPKPAVAGSFLGNGKAAKLAFVSARPGEIFADKPSILLVFTEKDHTKDPKPDFNASFGRYGSALIISAHEDGSIFGCQVAHSAHNKGAFSSTGRIHMSEFDVTDLGVSGKMTTGGELEFFGQTWNVDVSFAAPLNRSAAKTPSADPKPAPKMSETPKKPSAKPAPAAEPRAPQASVAVSDLPFLKNATDVEYKKVVGMLNFKSGTGVAPLAAQIQKELGDQGWKVDGAELVTPNSTILRRKNGDSKLTIFIKPAGKGSDIRVMSEGLDWSKIE